MGTGRLAIEPSMSVARLLQKRRRELGLSLRQVQQRTEEWGEVIPFTTLGKIERGRVDPGFRRLHVLFKVYDLSPQLAHELVEIEQLAGEAPDDLPPQSLYEKGIWHWKAGDLKKGLSYLLEVRARTSDKKSARVERQKTILAFAVAAGSLGRNRLPMQIVDELLLEPPEPELLVAVLVQAAVCWRRLGSGDVALGLLTQAEVLVEPADSQNRAWIHHTRANTLATMGRLDDADAELSQTLSIYRKAADAYGEGRALNARVEIRMGAGEFRGARRAARAMKAHADRNGLGRLSVVAQIQDGRALLNLGELDASVSSLRIGLSATISTEDRAAQFYAHYYLWKAYEKLGQGSQAAHELQNAQYYIQYTDEKTPETDEIRTMLATPRAHRKGRRAGRAGGGAVHRKAD